MDTLINVVERGLNRTQTLPVHEFYHRILLVEDDSTCEDMIRFICEGANPTLLIKCVKSAEAALELLSRDDRFDLIVADHFLGGETTGFDLWKYCRDHYVWIPFVMTTGLEPVDFLKLASNEPDYPYFMSKPLNNKELSRVVTHYLNRNM